MRSQGVERAFMVKAKFEVTCQWDDETRLWFVLESNVPGLSAEAATKDEMVRLLDTLIPQLVALNCHDSSSEDVPLELLFQKDQAVMAHC